MISLASLQPPLNGNSDLFWMEAAISLAKKAACAGEVPVGALLVKNNQVVGEGYNRPIGLVDPTAHAEIIALRTAARNVGNYRLINTVMYVTLEPCAMCASALVHARISRLVYGAFDPKNGAVDSTLNFFAEPNINHRIVWQGGILADSCSEILKQFFRDKRKTWS